MEVAAIVVGLTIKDVIDAVLVGLQIRYSRKS